MTHHNRDDSSVAAALGSLTCTGTLETLELVTDMRSTEPTNAPLNVFEAISKGRFTALKRIDLTLVTSMNWVEPVAQLVRLVETGIVVNTRWIVDPEMTRWDFSSEFRRLGRF